MSNLMSESEVQQNVQLQAMNWGSHLLRNNSGAFKDATGRHVRYGLGNISKKHNDQIKSSDLIGFTVITIAPEMVGRKVAVFTAIECKEEAWTGKKFTAHEIAQHNFIHWIVRNGGFAGFASHWRDLVNILRFEK